MIILVVKLYKGDLNLFTDSMVSTKNVSKVPSFFKFKFIDEK